MPIIMHPWNLACDYILFGGVGRKGRQKRQGYFTGYSCVHGTKIHSNVMVLVCALVLKRSNAKVLF